MIPRNEWHPDITDDEIMDAVSRQTFGTDDPGFCLSCGLENGCCEPDARNYQCESCGEHNVYGASELLFWIGYDLIDEGNEQ